ncbi:MAG: hypothetical protein OER90_13920 [Gemmatimonadota bacterium]|nr:hypothetical protein [Gemmatimonadota bacterium]
MKILSSTSATVYFDNCLVGAVVKGNHPAQMPALSALLRQNELGGISAVASTEVLGEIRGLPEQYRGPHLEVWNQLRRLPAAPFTWVDETSTSTAGVAAPDYVKLSGILPDEMDRRHMFHAVKNGVRYFAPVDQHSILSRSSQLEAAFPIKCGTPSQVATWLGITGQRRLARSHGLAMAA